MELEPDPSAIVNTPSWHLTGWPVSQPRPRYQFSDRTKNRQAAFITKLNWPTVPNGDKSSYF
jgi:hypothetical protein